MTGYALISPGGSPGATTAAIALALTWPVPVILAECDPAGGSLLPGLFAGHLAAPRGLLGVALEAAAGPAAAARCLAGQLLPLDESGQRRFLAGIADPREAPSLAPAWPQIAGALAGQGADVIADCGRLGAGAESPAAVISGSALAVLVMGRSLRQVAAARPRAEMAAAMLGGRERLALLLVGDRGRPAAEISGALGAPVLGVLPADPRTAALLSDGRGRRSGLAGRPLMRAARTAGEAIRAAADAPGGAPGGEGR